MKHIILAHLLIALALIALLSVFSYGYGVGYIYMGWRGWQLQTNIWFVLFALMTISLSIQLIWLALKRYLNRKQRLEANVFEFKALHPYEQLAVIWLLNAAQDQQQFIRQSFEHSELLKQIIDARLAWLSQDYATAHHQLKYSNVMAFELAELQRIDLYLSENEGEKALTHLEFLTQHELSPWLKDVKSAYELRLQGLWGNLAVNFPWLYLRSTQYGHLDEQAKIDWLKNLLSDFNKASVEDLEYLTQRYLDLESEIEQRPYEIQVLWLKVLSRLPDLSIQHEQLAISLLKTSFNQDVFYLWFQQQLLAQSPDYVKVEQQIQKWEMQYSGVPVLSFAKWHVYQASQRFEEAEKLLDLYPNNVLMNYLRIKSALQGQDHLLPQLNYIFENNSNFMAIKI